MPPHGDLNRIAFINLEDQLETIAADGLDRRQLSEEPGYYRYPTWSPDGTSIAVLHQTGTSGEALLVKDSATPSQKVIYSSSDQQPFYLYWSPNSQYLTFLASHPRGGLGLHQANAVSGRCALISVGQPYFWVWHGDSRSILIHAGGIGPQAQLAFVENGSWQVGREIAEPGLFQTPGISFSGRYYSFVTFDYQERSQLIIEQATNRQQLLFAHEGLVAMGWSPTADQLAYTAARQGSSQAHGPLRVYDVPERRMRTLTEDEVLAFFWSPDGRHIAYFTQLKRDEADPEGGLPIGEGYAAGRRLTSYQLSLEPWLGVWVVDVESGIPQLLSPVIPHPTFLEGILPYFDQYAQSHAVWSPLSDELVLTAVVDGMPRIVCLPINGLPPRYIADGVMPSWSRQ